MEAYLNVPGRGDLVVYSKGLEIKIQEKKNKKEKEALIAHGFIFKGNGSFMPTFSFCNKYFNRSCTRKEIEDLLPVYSKSKSDTSEKRINVSYQFSSNGPPTTMIIETDFKNNIKRVVILNAQVETDINSKVLQAGYQINYTMDSYCAKAGLYSTHNFKHSSGTSFKMNGNYPEV